VKKILFKYKYHLLFLFVISILSVFIEINIYKEISVYSKGTKPNVSLIYYFLFLFFSKYVIIIFAFYYQPYIAYKIMSDISKGVLFNTLKKGRFDYPLSKVIRFTAVETEHLVMSFLLPILVLIVELIMQASIIWYFILLLSNYNFNILIPLILILLIMLYFIYLLRNQKKLGKSRQQNEEFRYREIKTFFEVYEEVKNFPIIEHFKSRYMTRVKNVEIVARSSNFNQQLPRVVVEIFGLIFLILLSYNFYANGIQINEILSTMTILGLGALRIVPSLTRIMSSSQTITFSYKSYQLIDQILSLNNSNTFISDNYNFQLDTNSINFYAFKNLYQIKFNMLNVIKGKSGCGKSTFLNSLNEWLSLDEKNVVSFMPQDSHLFSGTLKENLLLFDDRITKKEIENIFNELGLLNIFERFYDSTDIIDEEATILSGGEIRRIVLARHLLRKPSFLLLDEPTSGLDNANEIAVFDLLNTLSKRMTIILVSHSDQIELHSNQILEF